MSDVKGSKDDSEARDSLRHVIDALTGLSDEMIERVLLAACEFYGIERD